MDTATEDSKPTTAQDQTNFSLAENIKALPKKRGRPSFSAKLAKVKRNAPEKSIKTVLMDVVDHSIINTADGIDFESDVDADADRESIEAQSDQSKKNIPMRVAKRKRHTKAVFEEPLSNLKISTCNDSDESEMDMDTSDEQNISDRKNINLEENSKRIHIHQ